MNGLLSGKCRRKERKSKESLMIQKRLLPRRILSNLNVLLKSYTMSGLNFA